ncbi:MULTISPECIES: hypothetical protein [unclassified Leptolyngbya]|uniref:hypothetical protein n=1 Tax=unclassified Leptolyngbya TaxID=2650499 RepID=UPI001688452E|nr:MULTISPECIES: hypothetical protein [unclassified Leptolyngbya]MBD1911402.1 hypothetical protein [Leptolyngbya sp. FACHB-8]MBD2159028.1 hypothetical protein [Leptolyngbya sp. FACHB-16]
MKHPKYGLWFQRTGLIVSLAALLLVGAQPNAAFSCQRVPGNQISARLDQPFQLGVQQQIVIDGLTIQFLGVSDDSRCPSNVQCIWAGQVSARFRVSANDAPAEEVVLTKGAGADAQSSTTVGRYHIQLSEVAPYPNTQQPIEAGDYTVTLTITSNPQ